MTASSADVRKAERAIAQADLPVRKVARLDSRVSVRALRGNRRSASRRSPVGRRSAPSHLSAASRDRRFLANARKALLVDDRRGVTGATATSGPSAGRAKIASATHRAKDASREAIGQTGGHHPARDRARPAKIASAGRHARAASPAENVSVARIARADQAAAGRRDSGIGRVPREMATGRVVSTGHRAIAPKARRATGAASGSARHAIATAIDPVLRARLVKETGLGRHATAIATVRGRRVGRGRPVAGDSGRRVALAIAGIVRAATVRVAAVRDAGLRDRGRRAAPRARRARRGRRVRVATVRLASGATTSSAATQTQ
jgi:hypothetical protein